MRTGRVDAKSVRINKGLIGNRQENHHVGRQLIVGKSPSYSDCTKILVHFKLTSSRPWCPTII